MFTLAPVTKCLPILQTLESFLGLIPGSIREQRVIVLMKPKVCKNSPSGKRKKLYTMYDENILIEEIEINSALSLQGKLKVLD